MRLCDLMVGGEELPREEKWCGTVGVGVRKMPRAATCGMVVSDPGLLVRHPPLPMPASSKCSVP